VYLHVTLLTDSVPYFVEDFKDCCLSFFY